MKPHLIVWDLETVPDLGGFAAANDLVGKSDVEVRAAIGDKDALFIVGIGIGWPKPASRTLRAVRCGRRCKHRCGAREGLTRPGVILDGAMEKEVSNGSRHGPLPE
jgi:hypothetical protein